MNAVKTILIVDDEEPLRLVFSSFLSSIGYDVKTAANGFDAIEIYKLTQIDIVLLDLKMPQLSGEKTLVALKSINPSAKIIIISGYLGDISVDELKQLGATDVLEKPFELTRLQTCLQTHIGL